MESNGTPGAPWQKLHDTPSPLATSNRMIVTTESRERPGDRTLRLRGLGGWGCPGWAPAVAAAAMVNATMPVTDARRVGCIAQATAHGRRVHECAADRWLQPSRRT